MNTPLVSVNLCVYNGEKYLAETIESIINQTYKNIELIIVDDVSKDTSRDIIKAYAEKDSRIRVIFNEKNLGMAENRNTAIRSSKGTYVAIHDHDDISMPERIARQVAFFENDTREDYIICGTWGYYFGDVNSVSKPPVDFIREFQIENCVYIHSSVMYRLDYLRDNNLYFNPELTIVDDYELQYRALNLQHKKGHNLPEFLVKFRVHATSNSHGANHQKTVAMSREMRLMQFAQLSGGPLSENDIKQLDDIYLNYKYFQLPALRQLKETSAFFDELIARNRKSKAFDEQGLRIFFGNTLNLLFFRVEKWGMPSFAWYIKSKGWKHYLKFNSVRDLLYLVKTRLLKGPEICQ